MRATTETDAIRPFATAAIAAALATNRTFADARGDDVATAMTDAVLRNPEWVVSLGRLSAAVARADVPELRRAIAARLGDGTGRDPRRTSAMTAEIYLSSLMEPAAAPATAASPRPPKGRAQAAGGKGSPVPPAGAARVRGTGSPSEGGAPTRREAVRPTTAGVVADAVRRAGLRLRRDSPDHRALAIDEIMCVEALGMLAGRGVEVAIAVLQGLRDNPANGGRNLTTFYVRGLHEALSLHPSLATRADLRGAIVRLDIAHATARAKAEVAGPLYGKMRRFSAIAAEALAAA